jgi:hypothetical protein
VDAPQAFDVSVAARPLRREAVGGELLPARDRVRDAQERVAVPDERQADERLRPALVVVLAHQRLDGAADGLARAVDPRPELRVAARVVAELVRDHAAEAALGEQVQQWEPDDHHPPPASRTAALTSIVT